MWSHRFLFLILVLAPFVKRSYSQVSEHAIPYSYSDHLNPLKNFTVLVSFDAQAMIKKDELDEAHGLKVRRFAKMLSVNLSPEQDGTWETTQHGRIWRIGIISPNAYSLYPVFGRYKLTGKARLFVYTPDYNELRGAFTKKNNNVHDVLAIAPLPSDTIIVELDVPFGQKDYGSVILSKIGHDYRDQFGRSSLKSGEEQTPVGNCYVDINCPQGADWQTDKKAVCKILVGGELCTGTLLANTKEEKIPYFLTASHCIIDSSSIPGSIFYFNYEMPYCGATISNQDETMSGATLISTTDFKLDFVLLKLNNLPPESYHPYFAGWDVSGAQPQSGTVIHHPNGAVKKISFDYSPLENNPYDFAEGYDSTSFWEVTHYDVGATEPGSSGAPIFNSKHRVVGSLTGGPASCSYPYADYYTRLSASWNQYPLPENQLKAWLDPDNSGDSVMDGYDPYGFNTENCDTAWPISKQELLDTKTPGFNWSDGYNSNAISDIAEKFYTPSWLDIFGVFFNVNRSYASAPLSSVRVKVWDGDVYPGNEIYTQDVFLKNLSAQSINFIPFDSIVKVSGNFFIGYSVSSPDTLMVYHAVNRGIDGPNTIYVNNGSWQRVDAITSPAMYSSLSIGLTECYGKVQIPDSHPVKIYPNPCSNVLYLEPAEGVSVTGVDCFDITGKPMRISYDLTQQKPVLHFNLPAGMYFLKVRTLSQSTVLRFIVGKPW